MGLTAIFGGTFNPFHIGHYEMLKVLQNDNNVEEIWIMPDKIPPHKTCDFLASDKDRIEMCEIVANDFSKAKLCLVEFEREGKSYTYDTVKYLFEKYPQKEFSFVLGGDMLVSFEKWYRFDELMKMLPFIAFKRTDTNNIEFLNCAEKFERMGMNITVKEDLIPNVSSTDFRKSNLKELLPEKVYGFIKERGIYGV
jgi:nicotinate-nucleotide adenylyltransferase